MKKKILIAVLVIALAITSVVALVACDNTNLDGKYVEQGQENWYLLIEGDTIKYIVEKTDGSQEVMQSGTFTKDGKKLIVSNVADFTELTIESDRVLVWTTSTNKTIRFVK